MTCISGENDMTKIKKKVYPQSSDSSFPVKINTITKIIFPIFYYYMFYIYHIFVKPDIESNISTL